MHATVSAEKKPVYIKPNLRATVIGFFQAKNRLFSAFFSNKSVALMGRVYIILVALPQNELLSLFKGWKAYFLS